ncbi:hypothetical protein QYF36_014455 [Acer negundo]|nr:hypothetical protein QYF36_014455 [Acer negundo]
MWKDFSRQYPATPWRESNAIYRDTYPIKHQSKVRSMKIPKYQKEQKSRSDEPRYIVLHQPVSRNLDDQKISRNHNPGKGRVPGYLDTT